MGPYCHYHRNGIITPFGDINEVVNLLRQFALSYRFPSALLLPAKTDNCIDDISDT